MASYDAIHKAVLAALPECKESKELHLDGSCWSIAEGNEKEGLIVYPVISAGHDRSLRRWERTSEPFFVEKEKEKRLESLFEAELEDKQQRADAEGKEGEGAGAAAGWRTVEGATAADALVDALEVAAHEVERQEEDVSERQPPNPLMFGLSPSAFVLKALVSVRPPDLESCLLMLPFTDALRLLGYLPAWLGQGSGQHLELVARVAVLLLRLHHAQLMSTMAARPALLALQKHLRPTIQGLKDVLGFNVVAMQHLQRLVRERRGVTQAGAVQGAKKALGK